MKEIKMKKIILGFLVLLLAACSFGTTEFSRNQEKWENSKITHYRYHLSVSCFCGYLDWMPLTIEVQNAEIISITTVQDNVIAERDPNYEYFAQYATIDNLFTELKGDLNGNVDQVTAVYDPTYGFPMQINIDAMKDAVDDELYLRVTKFEVLP